jgi:transposase-like protein
LSFASGSPGLVFDDRDVILLGCSHDTLRAWCVQAARDAGERGGLTSEEKARIKELEREVKELRTANEILKKASAYFAMAELDRPFRK